MIPAIAVPLVEAAVEAGDLDRRIAVPAAGAASGRPCSFAAPLSDIITADNRRPNAACTRPRMKRVDVPDVGHAPMLTEPEAVDAIDQFLRTVP